MASYKSINNFITLHPKSPSPYSHSIRLHSLLLPLPARRSLRRASPSRPFSAFSRCICGSLFRPSACCASRARFSDLAGHGPAPGLACAGGGESSRVGANHVSTRPTTTHPRSHAPARRQPAPASRARPSRTRPRSPKWCGEERNMADAPLDIMVSRYYSAVLFPCRLSSASWAMFVSTCLPSLSFIVRTHTLRITPRVW